MHRNVMLIDDFALDRFLAEKVIEKNSFAERVTTFSSAIDGLSFLRSTDEEEQLPDVIFLDIYMPIMNGFQFLDNFVGLPELVQSKCKIVILSSSSAAEDKERIGNYPFVKDFIIKPLSAEKLDQLSL